MHDPCLFADWRVPQLQIRKVPKSSFIPLVARKNMKKALVFWCYGQDMMSHTMIRDVVRIWRLILRVRQGRNGRTMSYCLARFSRQVQKEKEKERKFKESCVFLVPFSIIFHATWQVTKEAVRNLMHLWQHSGRSLAWQLNQLNLRTKKHRDITRFDSGGAASMCIMESHVWSLRSFFLLQAFL